MTRASGGHCLYTVWSYDLWGNDEDGWQVNDKYKDGSIELPCEPTSRQVVTALRRHGYVPHLVRTRNVEVSGESDHTLYIEYRGRPQLELQRQREVTETERHLRHAEDRGVGSADEVMDDYLKERGLTRPKFAGRPRRRRRRQ